VSIAAAITTYSVLKTLHVLAAVAWAGGAMMLIALLVRARSGRRTQYLIELTKDATFLPVRIFVPSSLVLVITGFWMVANGDLDLELWVILAIVGWVITFITGNFFLTPQAKKIDALLAEPDAESNPETSATIDRILTIARVDLVVLFLVIVDMVLKPG